jgi:hypothetical protein
VDYEPLEACAARFKGEDAESLRCAVQWLGPGGERARGAQAVFRALSHAPGRGVWLWSYRRVPGFAAVSEAAYAAVARHRVWLSRLDRLLWGPSPRPPSARAGVWLMLRLLGLTHALAFASLWVQAEGLWGLNGVLPVAEYLELARTHLGARAFGVIPTVFWLGAGDSALKAACAAGVVLGLAAAAGLAVGPSLLGCWALYLSFVSTGRDFMSFQWDILLVELTFLAALCAPWRLKPALKRWAPPAAGVFLLRLLLVRLMFESGCAKLLSGDPAWRDLTALTYHYWTQPLPTPLAWPAARLPLWFQKASCAAMFVIELGLPWLAFLPRRPRLLTAAGTALLMVLIALTGNYCFFNLLGLLLCLPLLDDASLGAFGRRLLPPLEGPAAPRRWAWPVFAALALLAGFQLAGSGGSVRAPRPVVSLMRAAGPLRLVNGYGLFAIMTTTRPEIELEGSADGKDWRPYVFKYKAGPVDRRPPLAAPHQPRLDWQMWFAALSSCEDNEWLLRAMARLLQGSPQVSRLFARDPFAGEQPPRYLRSTVYQYRFAPPGSKDWWVREKQGPYCPTLMRK